MRAIGVGSVRDAPMGSVRRGEDVSRSVLPIAPEAVRDEALNTEAASLGATLACGTLTDAIPCVFLSCGVREVGADETRGSSFDSGAVDDGGEAKGSLPHNGSGALPGNTVSPGSGAEGGPFGLAGGVGWDCGVGAFLGGFAACSVVFVACGV
jgi:hypothetical protein